MAAVKKTIEQALQKIDLGAEIKKRVDAAIQEKLKTLDEDVKTTINASFTVLIAKALGMKQDHWSKEWQVDNTNGRRSLFSDQISETAKKHAQMMAEMFCLSDAGVFIDDKQHQQMKKSIRADFMRHLKYELQEHSRRKASDAASELVDEEIKKMIGILGTDIKND